MSYVNPRQIVDTQSAQHLANLQQTITSTFANVAANYAAQKKQEQAEIKKRQEENAKIIKGNQDEEDLLRYDYQKYKADNPELNLPDVLPAFIDEYSDIKNALDLGTVTDPKEQAKLRSELAKLKTLPEQIVNGIKAFSELSITYKDTYGKINTQGGIDTTQTDPKSLKAVNIFLNNTPGTRNIDISRDKNGNLSVDYIIQETDEKGNPTGEPTRYPQAYLRDLLAGKIQGSIVVVPDLTKKQEDIDKEILVKDINGKSIVPSSLLKTITQKRGDFVEELKVVDPDKIKSQYGQVLKSNIESMDSVSFMSYYNNILNPINPITQTEAKDENIMQQKRQEGADLYINNYIQRYRKYEEVINKTRIPTPEKPRDLTISEKKDITNVKDAKLVASKIRRDDRLKFDYDSILELVSDYGLDAQTAGSEEEINKGSYSQIIVKGDGGKKIAILKSDTPDEIAKKIIRAKSPKLGEDALEEAFKELSKYNTGEAITPNTIQNWTSESGFTKG